MSSGDSTRSLTLVPIDGATMARMGTRVKDLVESPELMLLNLR
jgi:hypothetical protein